MNVLCLVPHPSASASGRLRIEQYVRPLEAMGIRLSISRFWDDAAFAVVNRSGHVPAKAAGLARGTLRRIGDLMRARRFDLVVVHRESAPVGPPVVERFLHARGVPYVFDFDDALFLSPVHPANRRWRWLRHGSRVAAAVAGAAAVTTVNEHLATWARQHSADVTVLPTPVDTDVFRPRETAREDGPVVLGWTGSPTTAPYLRLLDGTLDDLAGRVDVVLRVIGGGYRHARVRVEEIPWTLEDEPRQVACFDVGLLPEPDDPWTRGKGAYKAILYMACAVPTVYSRVGVNPEVVPDGVAGLAAGTTAEWTAALEQLARDAALRRRLGLSGRRRALERYSIDALAPRFAGVLRRAAGRP